MRYGSLCSGIGGLDLAVEAVFGASPAWFCEADPHAASVLARHWPGVPVLPDIKTQDWSAVESVELVCAGYPCQPFSFAGKRGGEDDPRHLWPFVIDAVRHLGPRLVVLENVAGHLGLGFDTVLGDLAEAGFDAEWTTLRASDVGACHRRERLFVVAHARCGGLQRFREPRIMAGQSSAPGGETPQHERSWDALGGGREVNTDSSGQRRTRWGSGQCGDGQDGQAAFGSEGEHRATALGGPSFADADSPGFQARGRAEQTGGGLAAHDLPVHAESERRRPEGFDHGLGAAERSEVDWGHYAPAIARWEQRLGRPAPAPTDERGRLNAVFVEWMQGFDEDWVDGLTRSAALRALGNACVPQQGEAALRVLA